MQPTLCSKCKKNVAVVFISRMNEKGEPVNEGLCLQCAAKLGLPQVEDMMKRMGITPEDLESLSGEMMQAFGGAEELEDLPEEEGGDEDESGKTATFPFLNRLFGGSQTPAEKQPGDQSAQGREAKGGKTEKKRKFLDNYCINLSRRAREGKLDAVIGREEEIERVVQILNRRQKNNPCLIGEPGVGKTAIAEGLAQRIVAGQVPFKLRDKEVYLLDLTALVAGTQFRGQFESRMKGLIEEIRKAGNIILVIDEVHNIVGAGDAEGSMNAANILKPALSRGEIQVIGATTFNEYRKFIEKDSALERRFQWFFILQTAMLLGIIYYVYQAFYLHTDFVIDSQLALIALFAGFFTLYFGVKYGIYKFVNWVFFHRQNNEQWNRSWRLLSATEGVLLFPLVLLVVYFDLPLPSAFIYTASIIVLVKILTFYKSFTIFFSQSNVHLQIILYFCALELMPIVTSWGILEMIASYLNINF